MIYLFRLSSSTIAANPQIPFDRFSYDGSTYDILNVEEEITPAFESAGFDISSTSFADIKMLRFSDEKVFVKFLLELWPTKEMNEAEEAARKAADTAAKIAKKQDAFGENKFLCIKVKDFNLLAGIIKEEDLNEETFYGIIDRILEKIKTEDNKLANKVLIITMSNEENTSFHANYNIRVRDFVADNKEKFKALIKVPVYMPFIQKRFPFKKELSFFNETEEVIPCIHIVGKLSSIKDTNELIGIVSKGAACVKEYVSSDYSIVPEFNFTEISKISVEEAITNATSRIAY